MTTTDYTRILNYNVKVNETTDNQTAVSVGTVVKFFAVAVAILALYYLRDIVLVVLAAVVIASAIEPVVRRLRHYFKLHRIVAVVVVYLMIAAVLATLLVFFMPAVVGEAVKFINEIPRTVSLADLWSPIQSLGFDIGSNGDLATRTISLRDFITGLQTILTGTGESAFEMASAIFGGALSLVLIFVLSFYLAIREDGVDEFLRIITPVRRHEYIVNLWKRSRRKIGLWLQGQVILGLIIGVSVYVALSIVGIPYALALSVLAAALEILPVFGPILASVPAILIAFTERGLGIGLLVMGLYLAIQQLENHVFYPLVTRKVVGVNPIVVILALLVGAKLAGVLGALVAVPLVAAMMEYVNDIEERRKTEKSS